MDCHFRPLAGAIHGKEPQGGYRDIVKVVVGLAILFGRFFGSNSRYQVLVLWVLGAARSMGNSSESKDNSLTLLKSPEKMASRSSVFNISPGTKVKLELSNSPEIFLFFIWGS